MDDLIGCASGSNNFAAKDAEVQTNATTRHAQTVNITFVKPPLRRKGFVVNISSNAERLKWGADSTSQGDMKDAPPVIRATERQKLLMPALFRRGSKTASCNVVNLSESGCSLRLRTNLADVGDTVFIKPEKLETLAGTVRWKNDDWMGVEFHRAVYRPVVDHLVRASVAI